mmetsp:Transcript_9435/g.26684  ORF Transcript_9435/g.26684 Transcript_9435/m.26684 type:complete len:95 (-) Transcript_9435:272-556(-)
MARSLLLLHKRMATRRAKNWSESQGTVLDSITTLHEKISRQRTQMVNGTVLVSQQQCLVPQLTAPGEHDRNAHMTHPGKVHACLERSKLKAFGL